MASYPKQTPTLGNINFNDIKKSITDYLKQQDVIKDFNFEGSVLQTLINVLAYNTYYYAFYSNMVANEVYLDSAQRLDSIISLTKPLGYFVPLRTSARAVVNVSGLTEDIPQYAEFRGLNGDGVAFNFYTIKSYEEIDSDALGVEIYEGILTEQLDVTNLFDDENQRFFVNDQTVDTNSLKVEIQRNGISDPNQPFDTWILADNFGSTTVANQNVYYLERANNGFYVLFGKTNSLGNSVDSSTDKIRISYISTNGSRGNDIFNFSLVDDLGSNVNIGLVQKSSDGADTPNLDLIKFAAPKLFGAQNRAVTKEDIKGLIAPFFANPGDFNVFGGEELFPQRFGRVFFTADLDPTNEEDAGKIQNIFNILSEKCVVTVLPEFTTPKAISISNDVEFSFVANRSSNNTQDEIIKSEIQEILSQYDTNGEYNFTFTSSEVIEEILERYPEVLIEESDFRLYYEESFSGTDKITINLENEIDIPAFTQYEVTSEFKNSLNETIKLIAYYTPGQNKFDFFNLKTYKKLSNGSFAESSQVMGRMNLKKGIIEIYAGRLTPVTVAVNFKNSYFSTKTNNRVAFKTKSVEIK
jgi:hypothetical protein